MRGLRLQSALEYLMTYGWAILIIAVVVAAFVSIGVFSNNSLSPKATEGGCSVHRPGGPLTSAFINLEGVCNGELPRYVAGFLSSNGFIRTGALGLPLGSNSLSGFAWVYFAGSPASGTYTIQSYGSTAAFQISSGALILYAGGSGSGRVAATSTLTVPLNSWSFVGYTYSGGSSNTVFYMDGQSQSVSLIGGSGPTHLSTARSSPPADIGALDSVPESSSFKGYIADVQMYNTSLSSNDVAALYDEGIGGAPIALPWLNGWWPLDDDASDYSGNGNGASLMTNVTFVNNWANGYQTP